MKKSELNLDLIKNANPSIHPDSTISPYTLYTHLTMIDKSNDLGYEFWVACSELYMPEFITVNGMVFVEELFKSRINDYERYQKENMAPKDIEYWINLILLNANRPASLQYNHTFELYLAIKIKSAWQLKLKDEFPAKNFDIRLIDESTPELHEDVLITFFQR